MLKLVTFAILASSFTAHAKCTAPEKKKVWKAVTAAMSDVLNIHATGIDDVDELRSDYELLDQDIRQILTLGAKPIGVDVSGINIGALTNVLSVQNAICELKP